MALETLPMPATRTQLRIGSRTLSVSNLDKPLYPGGFTKGQLIDYYVRIAPTMLPHLRGRPVTVKRFPNGVAGPSFFEKHCNVHRPPWIASHEIDYGPRHKPIAHCVFSKQADLAWAAQVAAIELHTSLATARRIDRPTMIVLDLDPGPGREVLDCARAALRLRDILAELDLRCLVKTSGGKGLHLYIPLNSPATYEQTQPFAKALALLMAREDPQRYTAIMARAERGGKVYIDWAQNTLHKTTVCAYSMRAREEPGVSTPVSFDELAEAVSRRRAGRMRFGPRQVLDRVREHGDLFAEALKIRQKLPRIESVSA
jgi:bifunctional non-homologous end joining protein LigD